MERPRRPSFSELPLRKGDPPYSAWGLYGADDELGTMNLITPAVTRAAVAEVKLGVTIPLDLPLDAIAKPFIPSRVPYEHKLLARGYANDDEIRINTQSTSQWDSLRHFPYQSGYLYYNGVTNADISGAEANDKNGIQNIARKGVATRGVLVDWCRYAKRKGIEVSPFERREITIAEIEEIAEECGLEFREGDLFILRTGLVEKYRELSHEEKCAVAERTGAEAAYIGVECNEVSARWFWTRSFAAVATDTLSFEAWPRKNSEGWTWLLHEVFLAGWGMPIGELWDLERVAEKCEEVGRWSFLVTSQPLIIEGGVASPPNAMAVL
ncbi:hypothetical protein BZA70DRAFT_93964 [Myxozyma melibiosi]|uniref:Cyclase n=1 Tax=Myxozyma melibiosi TaxID=54550 RepID=A0ABR1EZ10_9ASCO